jgi:GMP synthase-like glutamine amidotransferase
MPNCLVVQHAEPESPFAIATALSEAGVTVDRRRVFAGDAVPARVAGLDGLVVMGGPMGASSDEGFASRQAELSLLAGAVSAGLPTLGVCLGAQLLALAAGGSVFPGDRGPEIGWGEVTLSDACRDDELFCDLPGALTVLHWHGDTFALPPGGHRLMSSAAYPNQAFRVGDSAWGVQFHLEVTGAAVDGFLSAFGADAERAPGGPERIRAATEPTLAALAPHREAVLARFAGLVAARAGRTDLGASGQQQPPAAVAPGRAPATGSRRRGRARRAGGPGG